MKKNILCLLCLLASNLYPSNETNNPAGSNKRTFSTFSQENKPEDENVKKRKIVTRTNNLSQQPFFIPQLSVLAQQKILAQQINQMNKLEQLNNLYLILCSAIKNNDTNTVSKLLGALIPELRISLLTLGQEVYQLLCQAIREHRLTMATLLIEGGASLTSFNSSPIIHFLIYYSEDDNVDATIALLNTIFTKNPTLVNSKDMGMTPLHCALQKLSPGDDCSCYSAIAKLVDYLMEKKADPHSKDNEGRTALQFLAQEATSDTLNDLDEYEEPEIRLNQICTTLIKHGANVNEKDDKGFTPLHYLSKWGVAPLVELLLKNGAKPNNRTVAGSTPLFLACKGLIGLGGFENLRYQTIKSLLKHGGKVNKDNLSEFSMTPLNHLAIANHRTNSKKPFARLLKHGAILNIPLLNQNIFAKQIKPLLATYLNKKARRPKPFLSNFIEKKQLPIFYSNEDLLKDLISRALVTGDRLFGEDNLDKNLFNTDTDVLTTKELDSLVKKIILTFFLSIENVEDCRKFPLQQEDEVKQIYFTPSELKLFREIYPAITKDPRLALLEKIAVALKECSYFEKNLKGTARGSAYNTTGKKSGVLKKDIAIKFDSYLPLPRLGTSNL